MGIPYKPHSIHFPSEASTTITANQSPIYVVKDLSKDI